MVGPGVALSKVVVALNNKGVYIMDDSDTIRMHIAFWEVATVTKGRWVCQRRLQLTLNSRLTSLPTRAGQDRNL